MPRTSEYVKEKVANLLQSGKRQHEIVAELKAEGLSITRQTVSSLEKRLKQTGIMADKISTGRPCTFDKERRESLGILIIVGKADGAKVEVF